MGTSVAATSPNRTVAPGGDLTFSFLGSKGSGETSWRVQAEAGGAEAGGWACPDAGGRCCTTGPHPPACPLAPARLASPAVAGQLGPGNPYNVGAIESVVLNNLRCTMVNATGARRGLLHAHCTCLQGRSCRSKPAARPDSAHTEPPAAGARAPARAPPKAAVDTSDVQARGLRAAIAAAAAVVSGLPGRAGTSLALALRAWPLAHGPSRSLSIPPSLSLSAAPHDRWSTRRLSTWGSPSSPPSPSSSSGTLPYLQCACWLGTLNRSRCPPARCLGCSVLPACTLARSQPPLVPPPPALAAPIHSRPAACATAATRARCP